MKGQPSRLSQADVADAIRAAVDVEGKRIENLDAESIEMIAGGDDWTGSGPTMGMVPPKQ